MTTVYFIRHGIPDLRNKTERRHLSQRGLLDSYNIAKLLKRTHFDNVYSSPYERAYQTVKPLADSLKKEIVVVENFKERTVGTWVDDFDCYAEKQWLDFDYKLPLGESLREAQERNVQAFLALLAENQNKTVIVGTHGTALSLILHHFEPDFGYEDFNQIKDLMPYILKVSFDGEKIVLKEVIELYK
ncbi:histidine phosphatase family protein [Acholeplasma hippikon]|uniref:Bifunctional RNase H/acid phosphatase n=1 Tax=Acholeplasma hippikon TaxID=264636 RepID=A0A449BHZ3_9MOLU|nr:histidine phosphatase family protein [Acholeplasma hippikon]VEU82081.1 bifunctional RNase H/acid phosphatase [Acholeplasma hippikon]